MSCHPTHFEGPPAPNVSEEEIERNWKDFKKEDQVDPRAIHRHHHFKPGHEPDYAEPESGWQYLDIKFEGEAPDPDQRDMLHGGPESGLPCHRCGTMTHIVGSTTLGEMYAQQGVELVNELTPERAKEIICILACPECKAKFQWYEDSLPVKVHRP